MLSDSEREMLALLIGQQVRDGRRRLGLSQIELAQGIGSQSMISLIESGRQLPLPDVLHLLASRLDDEMLRQYEAMMSSGTFDFGNITELNHAVLLNALRTQRGRWQDAYGKVAIQLCEHHYNIRIFGICREICQLIDDRCESTSIRASAYFYYGSTCLFEDNFADAQKWLRKAELVQDKLEFSMQGKLMYNLAFLYTSLDVQGMAMWYAKIAVDKFSVLHDFPRQAKSLGLFGTIQQRVGLFEDAQASLNLALEIAQKWELAEEDCARIACNLAETYLELGHLSLAKATVELAISKAIECNDVLTLVGGYRTHYLTLMKLGNTTEALESIQKAVSLLDNAKKLPFSAHTYLLYVDALSTADEKMSVIQKAFDYATQTDSAIEEAFAAECMASIYEEQDQADKAAHYRKLALVAYREHICKGTMFRDISRLIPSS